MQTIELFYSPGACSLAVHAALRQAELPYRLHRVDVRTGAQRSTDYRAVNPRGRVPALRVDGVVLTEVPALALWIEQQNPHAGLFPSEPLRRARALGWVAHLHSGVHPLFRAYWRSAFYAEDEAAHPALQATAKQRLRIEFIDLQHAIAAGDGFDASRPGFLDLYAAVFLRWSETFADPGLLAPPVRDYRAELARHPPLAAALDLEGVALDHLERRHAA